MLSSDAVLVLLSLCCILLGNGSMAGTRMLEPPSRATQWRFGYGTPSNVLDDKTDCGGYDVHYKLNRGRCGVCGDPVHMKTPRQHEAGGEYSPFPRPVRASKKNSYLTVVMETTGSLFGKFEFRLCPIPDPMTTPDQSCFDEHLLAILESEHGTSYQIGSRQGLHILNLRLPATLTCQHCILQWRHVTGFMTNRDSCITGQDGQVKCHVCQGCGDQVWYMGCTDVAILDDALYSPIPSPTPSTMTTSRPSKVCPCASLDPNDNTIKYSPPYHVSLSNESLMSHANGTFNNTAHALSNNVVPRNITMKPFIGYFSSTSIDPASPAPTLHVSSSPAPIITASVLPAPMISVSSLPVPKPYGPVLGNQTNTLPKIPSSTPRHALNAPKFRHFALTPKSKTSNIIGALNTTDKMLNIPVKKLNTIAKMLNTTAKMLNTTVVSSDAKHINTSLVSDNSSKPLSREFCYIANTRRSQISNEDFWCNLNCPGQGVKVCFFSTCKPVLCGDSLGSGRPSVRSASNMFLNAIKPTSRVRGSTASPSVVQSFDQPVVKTFTNPISSGLNRQQFGHPVVRSRGDNWLNVMSLFMMGDFFDV